MNIEISKIRLVPCDYGRLPTIFFTAEIDGEEIRTFERLTEVGSLEFRESHITSAHNFGQRTVESIRDQLHDYLDTHQDEVSDLFGYEEKARAEAYQVTTDAEEAMKSKASALLSADVDDDLSEDADLYNLISEYSESVLDYSKNFDGDFLDPGVHEKYLGQDGEGEDWIVKYVVSENRFLLSRDDQFYT